MEKLVALIVMLCWINANAAEFKTRYEMSGGTETATYTEGINFYSQLAGHYQNIQMTERGMTDSGYLLHLVIYSPDGDFNIASNRKKGRNILLINNAIHPGESDGVDASMLFLRDIARSNVLQHKSSNTLIAIIPFYNIGGVLNRNSTSRVNQNGPKEYGFRGNAKNYDLNRDFIKNDTANSRSFADIFHSLDPDVLVDTHVSNGADYQYTMTMGYPQKDKLGGVLGRFLNKTMMPYLHKSMEIKNFSMIPYVNVHGQAPDQGWIQFMDWPRYSSGYAALFHTIGFMSETHMLKPYNQRVESTYAYLQSCVEFLAEYGKQLQQLRLETKHTVQQQRQFALSWVVDKANSNDINFKGYEAKYKKSKVTTGKRLYYDRNIPFEKKVPYYDNYVSEDIVSKPKAYVFSQAWSDIAEMMQRNKVKLKRLENDRKLVVEVYYIEDYETRNSPYEGHYTHSNVQLRTANQQLSFRKGDYYIEVNQWTNRYIIETLEPLAKDSFFNWNFFDIYLQRKEYYSSYVFEDKAANILKMDSILKGKLSQRILNEESFKDDAVAQLHYIFENSEYREPEYRRYPVFRVNY